MEYLLNHLLINSAKLYPDKFAVICGEEKFTYKELNEVTNKLATQLEEHGVKRGDRVGIYINKSIASIISIYGILKTGAVYVPLDPHLPLSRLLYIIQNCAIKCLLTSFNKSEIVTKMSLEKISLEFIVILDSLRNIQEDIPIKIVTWENITNRDGTVPLKDLSVETDLAYILYTSGSTGVPKGVMISHLNALTFIRWAQETFHITSGDRISNHAPLHFDLSIFDIFVACKAGATVVLVPEGLSTFPISLADWIEHNRISIWYSVPSILSMLVLHGKLHRYQFSNLRSILFAGEVFPVKYLRDLMVFIPHAEYYNLYGPTETNVVTYFKVENIPPDQIKPIPIGKACSNMEVFALMDDGKLVIKPGQVGELYARGSCVAQGYWGDIKKTDDCFVINHTQPYYQEKTYKTGDLVTMDEDGNYIYIGRRDNMVKSRGYRIELGEIESVLYSHPEVKEAAVVGISDDLFGNLIKAFIVLINKEGINSIELRTFCLERIPKYMVPEIIEFRDSLPKTSTGKINKPLLV